LLRLQESTVAFRHYGERLVQAGHYQNASEVLRDGLRLHEAMDLARHVQQDDPALF
jgi:putative addiction module CopG family antidote